MLRLRGPQLSISIATEQKKKSSVTFCSTGMNICGAGCIIQSRDANTVTKSKEVKTGSIFTVGTKLIL